MLNNPFGAVRLDLTRPQIMGILNVTPDSFSDGGQFTDINIALKHALTMIEEGARIIDIGGESTRPNATPVTVEEEARRVLPVIEALRANSQCLISIDTSQPDIMRAAVKAGADMINDVRALQLPGALAAASDCAVPVCLMHMQGQPDTMQIAPSYEEVVQDIRRFLSDRIQACVQAGIPQSRLIIDPGFCFGKTVQHNLTLLNQLHQFTDFDMPLLVGLSRKSIISKVLDIPVEERVHASTALAVIAVERGAHIIRCHDVKATYDAVNMASAVFLA